MKIHFVLMLVAIDLGCAATDGLSACTLDRNTTAPAYQGWPIEISCSRVLQTYRWFLASNGKYGQGDNTTCSIVDAKRNITLATGDVDMSRFYSSPKPKFLTPDIDNSSSTQYLVIAKGDSACYYEHITLLVAEDTTEKCDMSADGILDLTTRANRMSQLTCEDKLVPSRGSYNHAIEWYRNCSERIQGNNKIYSMKENKLLIASVDFSLSGTYSCVIKYKNRKRFIQHFRFCVKPATSISTPSISCPTEIPIAIGRNATITCHVNVGPTSESSFTTVYWTRIGNKSRSSRCITTGTSRTLVYGDFAGKGHCYMNMSQAEEAHNERCYLYEPTEDEKLPRGIKQNITFSLSQMTLEDYGTYHVKYDMYGVTAEATVKLIQKFEYGGLKTYLYVIIAFICVIVLSVIFILLVVLIRKRCGNTKYLE